MNISNRLHRVENRTRTVSSFPPPSQDTLDELGCHFWLQHLAHTGRTPPFAQEANSIPDAAFHFAQLPEAERQYWYQYVRDILQYMFQHPQLVAAAIDEIVTEWGISL